MNYDELKQIWAQKYDTVPQQLEKLKQIPAVATAFNTNIRWKNLSLIIISLSMSLLI